MGVRDRGLSWVLGLGILAAGCGGSEDLSPPRSADAASGAGTVEAASAPAPASPSAAYPAGASAKSDAVSRRSASAEAAPRESSPGAVTNESTAAREPHVRPGLGTEWGETRTSRIREMAFERDSSDPTSVIAIQYNDRDGVQALASARDARALPGGAVSALGGAVRVTIEDENGGALRTARIADRTVVLGRAGERYTIVLTNRTGHRFEAVASVDGLDVMSGRTASFDQRGYILLPFATVRIDGFRRSERAVAAFRFSKVAESYAAQTGSARNVGVIGVAFFREQNDTPWTEDEIDLRDSASPFPAEPGRFARPPR
jgi:hypothetical protein